MMGFFAFLDFVCNPLYYDNIEIKVRDVPCQKIIKTLLWMKPSI